MPIQHAIWKVGMKPEMLPDSALAKEQMLEDMITTDPRIVSDEWMLIGRQEQTTLSGTLDLLAVAPDGSLVLIELKRNKTPREVVAQAIDYAVWVEKLKAEDIAAIYGRFAPGHSLSDDFKKRFGHALEEDSLNHSHQIIVVASSLDASSERIITYLSERDIPINVLCFQVFTHGKDQFLSRAWLLDPVRTQVNAADAPARQSEPWNGEFYASFGHYAGTRLWDDAVKYGFISAGDGTWYTKTLQLLSPGDRIWVKAPGYGFVGVGRVTGPSQPALEFRLKTDRGKLPALAVLKAGYFRHQAKDPQRCEYFVPVTWLQTVPVNNAVNEVGLFGNQNTVCQPTTPKWRHTVDRLKKAFPNWDK